MQLEKSQRNPGAEGGRVASLQKRVCVWEKIGCIVLHKIILCLYAIHRY